MKFPMKTLALTLGLLAKMNTSVNAEKEKKVTIQKAAKTEISELKSSGEWPKGASASTIAYLTSIGQWPLKTSGSNTVASAGNTPANDSCASATEITWFSPLFSSSGDTTNASPETGVPGYCGTSYSGAPAVWYKVTGTGEVMVAETVDPQGYDTKIHVYSGSCGSFDCVTGNDDGNDNGLLSKVEWLSVPGVEYYILVNGWCSSLFGCDFSSSDDSSSGPYNLRVSKSHSSCFSATEVSTLPFTSSGDTTDASIEPLIALSSCDEDYEDSPIAWYKVTGTGGSMTAETLEPEGFDTMMHVYSGSCGDFTCVGGNDDKASGTYLSKVTWDSSPCEEYYILVHGYDSDEYGEYSLEVTSDTTLPEGTVCSSAPSMAPSVLPTESPSSEPSWVDNEQCKKRDPENDVCAELDGRCKLDCEDDEDFVCVPGLCSYDRNWDKPTKSPKMRALMDEVNVVDIEVTADGHTERKLKATKAPSEKETKTTKAPKATKAPKSSCACQVPRRRG